MKSLFTVPNILSLLRIPIALGIIFYWDSPVKYILLAVGILLDFVDGYAARKLNQATKLGGILDPVCDKIFVLIIFLYAFITLQLPLYFLFFFFLRDIFTSLASLIVILKKWHKKLEIKARFWGKMVTNLQFITLILMVIGHKTSVIIALSVLLIASFITIGDYIIYFSKAMKK